MKEKRANYSVTIFTIVLLVIAIAEFLLDYEWKSILAQVIFYLALYAITAGACISAKRCDKRIEVLVYIVAISAIFLSRFYLLYIPGMLFLIFSRKEVAYLSRIIITCVIAFTIANTLLLGMVNNELVDKTLKREAISPSGKYVIEQVHHNGYSNGQAIKISIHRDLLGVLDISYKLQTNLEFDLSEIEWIDEKSFMIDGQVMETKF